MELKTVGYMTCKCWY